jgi:hypothetical protein
MQAVITEIKRLEETLPAVREAGIEALQRVLKVAQGVTGQSGVVARFLLGLYNGSDFKFDLTDLRYLDSNLVEDCLALLRMDSNPEKEVHQYIENGQAIWQELRRDWISDDGQLFAEIKKSSKYAHQVDWCRNGPCGYPFRVRIEVDSLDDFIVKGGVGGRYRLSDVNLYLMDGGKKIRVH